MAQTYRLVGAQDPASRIDQVLVESPSEENPDGKTLYLGGPAEELDDRQYSILSRFVRLAPVKAEESVAAQVVDQPGVNIQSLSTDVPPDPGTAPDVSGMTKDELVSELDRVRGTDPTALQDVSPTSKKEDLSKALREYHGQEA